MTREKGKRLDYQPENYIVFDLETTGLLPGVDEIIEISAIKVHNDRVEEEFSTLVNPGMHIPYAATRVNGITDQMVGNAPSVKDALKAFLEFTGSYVLVGHNVHTFDTNFVYDSALRELGQKVRNDYVDTLYLARRCLPQLRQHKLTDIAAHFGIATEGAHRALADCRMNYQCYVELGKLLEQANLRETPENCCPECGCILVKRKGRYGSFWGCTGYPDCRYTRKG